MSKGQIKSLKWCIKTFKPENVFDIPPKIWNRFGFNENNLDKINFIIHINHTKRNEYSR